MTMRFVRHKTNGDWGLGVVSAEDGSNLHILFEAAGYKKIAKKVPVLLDVPDEEVPREHRLRRREDWPAAERDAKRAQAKRDLPRRFDAFVQEFLAQYPNGFRSQQFEDEERAYKWKAVQYAREVLQKDELKRLFAAANYEEVIKRARRVLGKTNLAFPNELMKFDDIASHEYGIVAERIIQLVSAGAGTPEALEALAVGLTPAGAAKWTICSLIPFLLEPEIWPFVSQRSSSEPKRQRASTSSTTRGQMLARIGLFGTCTSMSHACLVNAALRHGTSSTCRHFYGSLPGWLERWLNRRRRRKEGSARLSTNLPEPYCRGDHAANSRGGTLS